MTDSSRSQLVGYLLQALDPAEVDQVSTQLKSDGALRRDCHALQRGLDFLSSDSEPYDPPPGLAKRTAQSLWRQLDNPATAAVLAELAVADNLFAPTSSTQHGAGQQSPHALTAGVTAEALSAGSPVDHDNAVELSDSPDFSAGDRRWHPLDIAVSAGIIATLGALILPSLLQSRDSARLAACQNNMREVYASLGGYAKSFQGVFPVADERGPFAASGIYAPKLMAGGFLEHPRTVICPESHLAIDPSFRIPYPAELIRATPAHRQNLQKMMGGSYAFSLGYMENGVYRQLRNLNRRTFALLADSAQPNQFDRHGGKGQNILFEDGHVAFQAECEDGHCKDNYFLNDENRRAAGLHLHDAVIVESGVGP